MHEMVQLVSKLCDMYSMSHATFAQLEFQGMNVSSIPSIQRLVMRVFCGVGAFLLLYLLATPILIMQVVIFYTTGARW